MTAPFDYYHELLSEALKDWGHDLTLTRIPNLPQKRMNALFEEGQLDIIWLVASRERNQKYRVVDVGITQGLLGQRVLLVAPENKEMFRSVTDLAALQQTGKSGGFGENWFDITVWENNGLSYQVVPGEWRKIYKILPNPLRRERTGIDYFSRGSLEIVQEAAMHPDLAIEPHLLLVYQRDFKFYLAKDQSELSVILESALANARDSGLMDFLIEKHFGDLLEDLNLSQRTRIQLETPE